MQVSRRRHQQLAPAPLHDLAGGALGPGAEHTVSPASTVPSDEKTTAAAGDEKAVFTAAASADNDSSVGGLPTEEERRSLRHVGDPLPKSAFLVAVVELCERFTYYGASGLFQNYVQRPLDGSEGRGALGLGHKGATGLATFFQFWCYGACRLRPQVYFPCGRESNKTAARICLDGTEKLTPCCPAVTPILGASSRTSTSANI